jgi:hypothetical protein
MNYFDAIKRRTEELDVLGQAYLNKFDFLPNDQICDRIWAAAKKIFLDKNEDFDSCPWWVAQTIDYCLPYSTIPKNGSIYFSLGFSSVSQDAHLRNLLEIAEGRETMELDFEVLAKKEIVEKYSFV